MKLTREEGELGIDTIATPVSDFENPVHTALAIVCPAYRCNQERSTILFRALLEVTGLISRLMSES